MYALDRGNSMCKYNEHYWKNKDNYFEIYTNLVQMYTVYAS